MGRFERRWRAASRRHWAILIACLALVVAAVRLAVGERASPGVFVLPSPARPSVMSATDSAAEAIVERALPVAVGTRGNERVEVCGLGWVEAGADGSIDPAILARMPALAASRRRMMDSLASSGDDFERAAALWLRMFDPASATLAADFREQLARSATTTRDPRVYALAFKMCTKTLDTGSCALLSARRWAQLDGSNGVPWIFLFDEATTRKDRQQAEEALFHLATAARVDDRFFAVPGLLASRAGGSDMELLTVNELVTEAIGLAAAEFPPLQTVANACRGPALLDDNRNQRCDAVASALADRSDTLWFASVGAAIGRRLGWPSIRTEAIAALSAASIESLPTQETSSLRWTCRQTADALERYRRQGVVGEVRYAREWIEASGTSVERYALKQAEMRRRQADALARAANISVLATATAASDAVASAPSR